MSVNFPSRRKLTLRHAARKAKRELGNEVLSKKPNSPHNHFAGWRGAHLLLNKRMRDSPSEPEILAPLKIFKEHILTDIGG
ncbi:MAG TPA: hypothetical protein VGF90_01450, partial [Verrucomicrobiae bacterium]